MTAPADSEPNEPDPTIPVDDTLSLGSSRQPNSEIPLEFLAPSSRPMSLGRIGHYEVLEVLGQGAFGIVLRAFDETLHRVVAVKVLAPELAATSPARKRFLREARASAQIRHENVVQVYAIEEQPLPFLVMEYIPGQSLQERMAAVGPLSPDEAVKIGIQIARGLAAAHETGLIHRDVKPGNVLLEKGVEGRVKLTDFGLARAADDASLTQTGAVAGTPAYMAPEQARGERPDHRADLFSLGSVLYAMVSGRLPFRAANAMAVLKRVCEDTPRPIREIIPEVPQWLCDVIAQLHAKDPADRFQSATAVVEALTKHEAAPPPRPKASRYQQWPIAAAAVVLLVLAGGVYWATRPRIDEGLPPLAPNPPSAPPTADYALLFDKQEHSVFAPDLARDADDPVTLECWFKMFGKTSTYRTILALGGQSPVWIAHSSSTVAPLSLRLPGGGETFKSAGAKIPFEKWSHVALVFDGKETRFYLDGKLASRSPALDPPSKARTPVGGLVIGSTRYIEGGLPIYPGGFVGQLDEIRVSRAARYDADFTPARRFETDADTLALYHCDEKKGAALTDSSGNGRHAAISNASWVEVNP